MHASPSRSQERLRLLFLTDCSIEASGGSERFLRNLANHLPDDECAVTVVQLCERPGATARVHAGAVAPHVALEYLPCGAIYTGRGLRTLRALRRRVRREGFHIIQSQHETADIVNACLPRGPLHAQRISNRRDMGFLKSARVRALSRLLIRRYDRIVGPSGAILDRVAATEGGVRARMACIPNGVDAARFRPAEPAVRAATRARSGWPAEDLLVGCVADLFDVKRHLDLIDAFAAVRTGEPRARLLLVGDGPMREAIAARIHEHGLDDAAQLLGARTDVDAVLPALDLFVLASDSEGLSNAILEAQACGLATVATRVGGNPDLVDAARGILVPARQPGALAAAMFELLRDPPRRAAMGEAARSQALAGHSLQAMTQAYLSLYRGFRHVA